MVCLFQEPGLVELTNEIDKPCVGTDAVLLGHLPATQMLWVDLGWCVFTGKKKDANSGLKCFVVYTFICGTHIAAEAISCAYELSYACQLFIAITNS